MSWWEATLIFIPGVITGWALASAVRGWRLAWQRSKVSTDKLRAELRERG